ncbi:MAG: ABC transporter ATP-binding protein [Burkholderiales bacterium]
MPQTDTALTVEAKNLTRNYADRNVVEDVSFDLRAGEVLGFLGPNGAGKSTTLQMLTGNLAPSSGEARICGFDIQKQPIAAKRVLGYLPEVPPLYPELTVDEFLRFAARLHRVDARQLGPALEQAKTCCGLHDVGKRLIANLSKGYQQRIGIAQAIIHNPRVLILDEPTVGLDPNQSREITGLIRALANNCAVILSTHLLNEAEAVCDRIQIMHHGKLVYCDSVAETQRRRRERNLIIGLHQPPALDLLLMIHGVKSVETAGGNLLRIRYDPGHDPSEALAAAAGAHGWGLFQLTPEQTDLQDLFRQLTP